MITEPRFSLDWVRLFPPICTLEMYFGHQQAMRNEMQVTASTRRRQVVFKVSPEISQLTDAEFTSAVVEPVMEKLMGMEG